MNTIKIFFLIAFCTLVSIRCKREEFTSVPVSADPLASLLGSWTIKNVTQKDEGAEIKNSPYVTMNLTSLFPYTQYKLTLTGGTTATTGTYTAVPGSAPQIIRFNTGTWQVDDPKNPKKITFINGTDKMEMQIGSYPTSLNKGFKLKQTKIDVVTNKPAVSYEYEFVKQ